MSLDSPSVSEGSQEPYSKAPWQQFLTRVWKVWPYQYPKAGQRKQEQLTLLACLCLRQVEKVGQGWFRTDDIRKEAEAVKTSPDQFVKHYSKQLQGAQGGHATSSWPRVAEDLLTSLNKTELSADSLYEMVRDALHPLFDSACEQAGDAHGKARSWYITVDIPAGTRLRRREHGKKRKKQGDKLAYADDAKFALLDRSPTAGRQSSRSGSKPGTASVQSPASQDDFMCFQDMRTAVEQAEKLLEGRDCTSAVLVDFTSHMDRPILQFFKRRGLKNVKIIWGSINEAMRLESQRQAYFLSYPQDIPDFIDEDDQVFQVIRHNLPSSFHGFLIQDELICIGWHVWFPTFNDCKAPNDATQALLQRLSNNREMKMKKLMDRLTMNGHRMPCVLARRPKEPTGDSAFELLDRAFRDHVEAVSHYWELHYDATKKESNHPDLKAPQAAIQVGDPLRTEILRDPRHDDFWPQSQPGRGATGWSRVTKPELEAARRFFGEAAFQHAIRLVPIYRKLKEAVKEDPFEDTLELPSVGPHGLGHAAAWLAFEDIDAALSLKDALERLHLRSKLAVEVDLMDEFSAIIIGLTQKLVLELQAYSGETFFEIKPPDKARNDSTAVGTVGYTFTVNGELPRLYQQGRGYSLVARIVPSISPGYTLGRVHFVCAGPGATDTRAAGLFLANHWSEIMQLYEAENLALESDSLAVVLEYTHHSNAQFAKRSDGKIHFASRGLPRK